MSEKIIGTFSISEDSDRFTADFDDEYVDSHINRAVDVLSAMRDAWYEKRETTFTAALTSRFVMDGNEYQVVEINKDEWGRVDVTIRKM